MADGAVAERAVGELLHRLRRARSLPGADQQALLGDTERAVFKLAMEKRQKVLEGSLGVAIAQMALYRFAIRSTPRPIRAIYGLGCLSATTEYSRRRASTVTRDMLTSILNLPEESSLGNEARIILADLEGPEGPLYTSTVEESIRKSIYERALAQPRAADEGDRHPQLSLQPRLLENMGSATSSPAVKPVRDGAATGTRLPAPADNRTVVKMKTRRATEVQDELDPGHLPPTLESDMDEPDDFPDRASPYDFAAAARAAAYSPDISGGAGEEGNRGSTDGFLTPSQQRAVERARRREAARVARMSHPTE